MYLREIPYALAVIEELVVEDVPSPWRSCLPHPRSYNIPRAEVNIVASAAQSD